MFLTRKKTLAVIRGTPAVYRGTVKPDSIAVASVEQRNDKPDIGQGMGFPSPGGIWEITAWGDFDLRNRDREKFYWGNIKPRIAL